MNDTQTSAFKAASGNADPALLSKVFIGALLALLILWVGWGFVHVYRGEWVSFWLLLLSGWQLKRPRFCWDMVIYIYPHMAGNEPAPVPGYSSVFSFYSRVQYALPGERLEAL